LFRLTRLAFFLFSLLFPAASSAQNQAFFDDLKQGRHALAVKEGKLGGPGGDVLREATADAQFVALGEDHGIQQIPEFAAAFCELLAPQGFHTLALEIGPYVSKPLEEFVKAADGAKRLAEFDKNYPETIAFYTWREEFAFLQSCANAIGPDKLRLWGLDQELMGAPVYLLERILETKPDPEARRALEAMLQEDHADHAAAAKTGNPGELFLMKAKQEDLDKARELLEQQGSSEAQAMFDALLISRAIYQKNLSGENYASNRQRALLMKKNFVDPYTAAFQRDNAAPKVLFKFGAWHIYRGINPLHSSEIGNLIGEAAEGHQFKSVHILILGVKGEQSRFAGIGRPFQPTPLDLANDKGSDFLFLKPLFENMVANLWTLYDLRGLRARFNRYGRVDPELERIIFGFDFVVLIPDPKASHPLG
jgi:hypothetical protein